MWLHYTRWGRKWDPSIILHVFNSVMSWRPDGVQRQLTHHHRTHHPHYHWHQGATEESSIGLNINIFWTVWGIKYLEKAPPTHGRNMQTYKKGHILDRNKQQHIHFWVTPWLRDEFGYFQRYSPQGLESCFVSTNCTELKQKDGREKMEFEYVKGSNVGRYPVYLTHFVGPY